VNRDSEGDYGHMYIGGNVYVYGTSLFRDDITVGTQATPKNAIVWGDLDVNDDAHFKSVVTIENDTHDGGTLLLYDAETLGTVYSGYHVFNVKTRINNIRTKAFFFAN